MRQQERKRDLSRDTESGKQKKKKKDKKKKAREDVKEEEEEVEEKKQPQGKLCSCAGCLDSPPDPEAFIPLAVQIIKRPMKQEGSCF